MISTCIQGEATSPRHIYFILLVLPILLAAGTLDQSSKGIDLPSKESYRSNFSDTILDSSSWRRPPPSELPWRDTPRSELGWRTTPNTRSTVPAARRRIELFPTYRPGRTTDFDHITREEKPLIKVFEFGQ